MHPYMHELIKELKSGGPRLKQTQTYTHRNKTNNRHTYDTTTKQMSAWGGKRQAACDVPQTNVEKPNSTII